MKFTENDIRLFRGISNVAGTFTMIVAFIMIFSLIQLKTINPLDNPALISVKEQYDKDPENTLKAEQVRAMDLMARKAYFASRRQVETGTYLLIFGAIAFVLFQRLIAGNEKIMPVIPGVKPDQISGSRKYRKFLTASAGVITAGSVIASFILRNDLPDLAGKPVEKPVNIS
jgi:outer membrane protein assembly factor BamB